MFEKRYLFIDMNEFRNALREYAVQGDYELKRDKNEPKRVAIHCLGQGCN